MTMQRDLIESLAAEPEFAGSAADNMEMVAALGGQVEIAGRAFPAPCAAVVALLDAIDSPFVSDTGGSDVTTLDIFRAIYLIGARESATLPVLRLMRRKKAFDDLADADDQIGGAMIAARRQAIADAEAELDAKEAAEAAARENSAD